MQKSQQNKEFWAEAERCLQCWRNSSARRRRQKTSFNPLSFACAKSLIESIGGLCLGIPGKLLAWLVSIVQSLSVSQLCLPPLVSTALPGLEGWEWMQQEGRDQAEEVLLTSPVLLCTGEGNAPATKTPELPVKVPDSSISSAEKSSTATGHQKYPKRVLQAKKLKIHGVQCTLCRLECLHLYPFPLTILFCLWLDGSTLQIHSSTALVLLHPDFTQKGLLSFQWLLARLGN